MAAASCRLAATPGDRRLPGRTVGGIALALPWRRRTLRQVDALRADDGGPPRDISPASSPVRGDPADHDRQLVQKQRCGRLGVARLQPIV